MTFRDILQPSFWFGLILGGLLGALTVQGLQRDWLPAAPPVDERPLTVRHDAKGDGRFMAPRSGNRFHRGIDLVAPLNSPVRAIRRGTVVQVGTHLGFGRFIELKHPHDLRSLYAHLNDVTVQPGQRVKQGQEIGTLGKTGNARSRLVAPHLHLEVWKHDVPIDPNSLGLRAVEPPAHPGAPEPAGAEEPNESSDARGDE